MDFKYKNLIYFTICEIMLDNLVKTNYTTLTNMCVNIYNNLSNGLMIDKKLRILIDEIIVELKNKYYISDSESIAHISDFIIDKEWVNNIKLVKVFKMLSKNKYK
jgi:hypothetical protein